MKIYNWQKIKCRAYGNLYTPKTFVDHMKKKKVEALLILINLSIVSPNHEIYNFKNKNFLKPISYSVIKHGLLGLNKYFATCMQKEELYQT